MILSILCGSPWSRCAARIGCKCHAVSYAISNDQAAGCKRAAIGPTPSDSTFVGVGCNPARRATSWAERLAGVSFACPAPQRSFSNGLLNNLGVQNNDPDPRPLACSLDVRHAAEWLGRHVQYAHGNGLAFEALDLNLGWIDVTSVTSTRAGRFFGFSSTDRFAAFVSLRSPTRLARAT